MVTITYQKVPSSTIKYQKIFWYILVHHGTQNVPERTNEKKLVAKSYQNLEIDTNVKFWYFVVTREPNSDGARSKGRTWRRTYWR